MYSNDHNLSLSVAVWLATDEYDNKGEIRSLSATDLLKSDRQLVLRERAPAREEGITDVTSMVSSRYGTAIHTAIENAWLSEKLPETLKALGIPKGVRDRIKVNPEVVEDGDIPVYMEIRSYKECEGIQVSGKFDFIMDGGLEDFKSTSTFTYTTGRNDDKYALQGSIYRWLNPEKITQDYMHINFLFTDWSALSAKSNPNYPQQRALKHPIHLLSVKETEAYVAGKIRRCRALMDVPEEDIPWCTNEELWQQPSTWKHYKDASAKRATRVFESAAEASSYHAEKNFQGFVKEVKGKARACRYCDGFSICTQKDSLIEAGLL